VHGLVVLRRRARLINWVVVLLPGPVQRLPIQMCQCSVEQRGLRARLPVDGFDVRGVHDVLRRLLQRGDRDLPQLVLRRA
jgi:hypothetical protein